MARYMGIDYEVSMKANYRVAMAIRRNREDIEEEGFDAVKDLFREEDADVIDVWMTDHKQDEHFTFAEMCFDLRIRVRAEDYDEACEEASGVCESVDLPVGVAYIDCEIADADVIGEAIDWDWASGE